MSFVAATARAKKVVNFEIFRMSRACCMATTFKRRVYRIDKSSLPNQLSIEAMARELFKLLELILPHN